MKFVICKTKGTLLPSLTSAIFIMTDYTRMIFILITYHTNTKRWGVNFIKKLYVHITILYGFMTIMFLSIVIDPFYYPVLLIKLRSKEIIQQRLHIKWSVI